jgi:starvation-inducible DNA-binding protein
MAKRPPTPPTPAAAPLHPTHHDLPARVRADMVSLLNDCLAELIDLATHAKEAHWNVRGPGFIAIHELFDTVHATAQAAVDDIAERAVQLGGRAHGTAKHVAKASTLPAYPDGLVDQADHAHAIARSIAHVTREIRAAIDTAADADDAATADVFTEHTRALDKILWMVEAHDEG